MSTLAKLAALAILLAIGYHMFFKTPASLKQSHEQQGDVLKNEMDLNAQNKEVVITVTDGVYVARSFSMANMAMIEGKDGIIIVDSTLGPDSALKVLAAFRNITDKPIKAILVTHFHPDHISGLDAILQTAEKGIDVYAHKLTKDQLSESFLTRQGATERTSRQFGMKLQSSKVPNYIFTAVHPTHTFDKELTLNIAGIKIQLFHTPGETKDHCSIWLPEKRVLFSADNLYSSFPNIYPVRGEIREVRQWVESLDFIRYLNPDYLVPSHMDPVAGKDEVWDTITTYRDAMQFVYDQTIRCINKNMHLDDIVRTVRLPAHLEEHKSLQQWYGTVEWSVRSIYGQNLGWFTGNPEDLTPLSSQQRAEKFNSLLEMSGQNSIQNMFQSAEENLQLSYSHFENKGAYLYAEGQWALEISAMALRLTKPGEAIYEEAKSAMIKALKHKARGTSNWTARNYYLSCIVELDGSAVVLDMTEVKESFLSKVYIEDIMSTFPRRFKAEECDPKFKQSVRFHFSDLKRDFVFLVRNCICEFVQKKSRMPDSTDVTLTMTSEVWRDVIKKTRSGFSAYMAGDIVIEGGVLNFKSFVALFD
ncbi:linear primary-alkylsulfatase-like [Ciona intestinalis]